MLSPEVMIVAVAPLLLLSALGGMAFGRDDNPVGCCGCAAAVAGACVCGSAWSWTCGPGANLLTVIIAAAVTFFIVTYMWLNHLTGNGRKRG